MAEISEDTLRLHRISNSKALLKELRSSNGFGRFRFADS